MKRLAIIADRRGSAAVEFALVAPTFLMFIFLILDGGRMIFTKQALNELATATARCAAIKATGCTTASETQSWAVSRGAKQSLLTIASADVVINQSAPCNGQSNMMQATISMNYKKGALMLLPQNSVPSRMSSSACFPIAS